MASSFKHWEKAYTGKAETEVSWYQRRPELSLELIGTVCPDRAASIIDIGGGASTLVDALLGEGYTDLTVLDVSATGMAKARERLGARAGEVRWIEADITKWDPDRTWDLWHDRAAFHFLTATPDQDAYLKRLNRATWAGSHVIISTFAPEGPEKCSGLPVARHDAAALAARLGPAFVLIEERREIHETPRGAEQVFAYAVFRRV